MLLFLHFDKQFTEKLILWQSFTLQCKACLCVYMINCFSCDLLLVTPRTGDLQAPLSMGFSRQEYWHGLPYPLSGYIPNPGAEPLSLLSPALAGGFFTTNAT